MPLQIMQNLYPESWLYLTGHCYIRSMFVKHHFVAIVVCLFFCLLLLLLLSLLLLLLLLLFIYFIIIFIWYKLDCNFFAELCKLFSNFK